jgi:16S rRNA (cytosine1402-N4)-methyltransferase
MTVQIQPSSAPHAPVLLAEMLDALRPADDETYVDGTFGAGGYTRAILDSAQCRVIACDRDPTAIEAGSALAKQYGARLTLIEGRFGAMRDHLDRLGSTKVQGIVLDIGVSSMQIDDGGRGFSFIHDGPLDMRMSADGLNAADIVNSATADELADLIFQFGEEKRSRRIARAIVAARDEEPLRTTSGLVSAIERATGPQRPGERVHPATRTFQALRIYVNSELEELASSLHAAEALLEATGRLVVVTFHSLEDRIVKRFLAKRSGRGPQASRHAPGRDTGAAPSFELLFNGHVKAGDAEIARNPRSRSAKLRAARRTAAPAWPPSFDDLGLPGLARSAS